MWNTTALVNKAESEFFDILVVLPIKKAKNNGEVNTCTQIHVSGCEKATLHTYKHI